LSVPVVAAYHDCGADLPLSIDSPGFAHPRSVLKY
jgi:hypothetical protein